MAQAAAVPTATDCATISRVRSPHSARACAKDKAVAPEGRKEGRTLASGEIPLRRAADENELAPTSQLSREISFQVEHHLKVPASLSFVKVATSN